MGTAGATKILGRSVEKHGIYYTSFYGDGGSKAYPAVKEVYKDDNKTVTKYECIGHYQKRVDCRLRKLKKNVKGFGANGRLTNDKIDTLPILWKNSADFVEAGEKGQNLKFYGFF